MIFFRDSEIDKCIDDMDKLLKHGGDRREAETLLHRTMMAIERTDIVKWKKVGGRHGAKKNASKVWVDEEMSQFRREFDRARQVWRSRTKGSSEELSARVTMLMKKKELRKCFKKKKKQWERSECQKLESLGENSEEWWKKLQGNRRKANGEGNIQMMREGVLEVMQTDVKKAKKTYEKRREGLPEKLETELDGVIGKDQNFWNVKRRQQQGVKDGLMRCGW